MPKSPILLVSGDAGFRTAAAEHLRTQGLRATAAEDEASALDLLRTLQAPVVVLGPCLQETDRTALLRTAGSASHRPEVIIVADAPCLDDVVGWRRDGVFAVLGCPPDLPDLVQSAEAAHQAHEARTKAPRSRRPSSEVPDLGGTAEPQLVGASAAMLQVFSKIAVAGESDVPVFIVGETGTGKELVARAIHREAGQLQGRSGSFVPVDLGVADHNLAESRLFGHREGAFTGAVGERRGAFALAEGGTIFLDEVANASPELQAKLLRVLQEREFLPLGGEVRETTTARPIGATNQDPKRLMKRGRLRADLWHRLAGHVIEIPPLRERMEDLEVLVPHLLRRAVADADRADVPTLTPDAWAILRRYPWPGNVRELENCLRVAVVSSPGPVILDTHLHVRAAGAPPVVPEELDDAGPPPAAPPTPGRSAVAMPWVGPRGRLLTWDEGRAAHIEAALRRTGGNVSHAARLLSVPRSTLHRWINELRVSWPE